MSFLADLWNWSMEKPWRTWMLHAVIAVLLAVWFGGWAAVVFYLLREVEQNALKVKETGDFDGRDAVLDALFPLMAVALYELIRFLA